MNREQLTQQIEDLRSALSEILRNGTEAQYDLVVEDLANARAALKKLDSKPAPAPIATREFNI